LGSSNFESENLSWDQSDRSGAPVRPVNPHFAQFTADLGVGASTRRRAGEVRRRLNGVTTSRAKPHFASSSSASSRPREASRRSRAAARRGSSRRPSRRRSSGPSHPEAHPPHPAPPQPHHEPNFALYWTESRPPARRPTLWAELLHHFRAHGGRSTLLNPPSLSFAAALSLASVLGRAPLARAV